MQQEPEQRMNRNKTRTNTKIPEQQRQKQKQITTHPPLHCEMDATMLNEASGSKYTRQSGKEEEKIKNEEVKEDHPPMGKAEETEGTTMRNTLPKDI